MRRAAAGSRSILLTAVLVLSVAHCGGERQRTSSENGESDRVGGVAVVCSQSAYESLNTFVSPDLGAADLRMLLFTPLVLYGQGGEYRPYLASSWEWGDDRRSLVFRIRTDLTWHDGTRLTAEDVAWTIEIAANPEYAYSGGEDLAALQEVSVPDSATIELRFAEPMVAGLERFAWLPILPRHLLADIPASEFGLNEFHRSPVGSGPYRFAERRADGSLWFDRYAMFPADLATPNLDRIVIRPITETAAILTELESGGVDLCITRSSPAERAQRSGRLDIVLLDPPGTQVIPLNTRNAPLDDPRVRRALSAALRRSEVAAAMSPVTRPARNPLPESSPWFEPELLQPDADSALAASLLEEAGWTAADGVRRNARGRELRFTLIAPQGAEDALTVVQAQWQRLGIGVDLRFMEWASYVPILQDPGRRPDAMALSFNPEKVFTPDSELYSVFHSDGFSNLGSYSVAAVDSLLERLQQPLSNEERRDIYRRIQRRVAEDVPILFTVYVPRLAIVGPRLEGVTSSLNGPFGAASDWWIPGALRR